MRIGISSSEALSRIFKLQMGFHFILILLRRFAENFYVIKSTHMLENALIVPQLC